MTTDDYQRLFEACLGVVRDTPLSTEEKVEQFEFVVDTFRPYLEVD